jgi:hypothetical protein
VDYASARSKAVAVARMYVLADRTPEPLGPGSKEKRSALEALGSSVGLDLELVRSKHRCAEAIAHGLDVAWDVDCWSAGDTITLAGMNRLVDAASRARIAAADGPEAATLIERLLSAGIKEQSQHDKEEPMPQDLTELEQDVADYLARLSEPGPVPEDFGPAPTQFGPTDVRFDDGSWRDRLDDVQAWLHFSGSLDMSSAEAFDSHLADLLGLDGPVSREELLGSLKQRLDRALALRDEFLATMEETTEGAVTEESASQRWADSWDEVIEDEGIEQSGQIDAVADTWPIQTFVQRARYGQLDLSPSYQRADVWPTGDAQRLIESILRGIPLPSVIILEKVSGGRTAYEVVDGKQRLTSVLRFIGAHPNAIKIVTAKAAEWDVPDALRTFQTNYPAFKALWAKHEPQRLTTQVERHYHFPFVLRANDTADSRNPLTGDREKLRGKYYSEIRDELIEMQGQPLPVSDVFELASDYKIPVIKYKKVTTAQIHEVFSLYNKQGKHLNAEEIRNALYHELDLMRALLVTAGDSKDVEAVAPFLLADWDDLASAGAALTQYKFGDVGYKRTKILSWVAAALFLDDVGKDGIARSTAAHINTLLQRVTNDKRDPLRDPETVRHAMLLLDHGLDAHASATEAWPKRFRSGGDNGSGKWQELRLVASLVALSAAATVLADDLVDTFEDAVPEIRKAAGTWGKPRKNQSRDQWRWIGFVVGELLAILDVTPEAAHAALVDRFGASGLKTLVEKSETPEGFVRT